MTRKIAPSSEKKRANLSKALTKRWANPEDRAILTAGQSAGSTEAWADPDKKKARLKKREETAIKMGFESYGKLCAYVNMCKMAKKYGISIDTYLNMTVSERRALRPRKKKK